MNRNILYISFTNKSVLATFFYIINYNIIVQVRKTIKKQKKLPVLRDIQYGSLLFFWIVLYLILTTIAPEQLTTERQGY